MKNDELLKYIDHSFRQYTGQSLPTADDQIDRLTWIHENSSYSLLAHNTDSDPKFIYANSKALDAFGYSFNEITQLQSKFSASEIDRQERALLLQSVKDHGIAMNYSGPRVKKDGSSFNIHHGIVWVVKDDHDNEIAQAALFWLEKTVPEWFNISIR